MMYINSINDYIEKSKPLIADYFLWNGGQLVISGKNFSISIVCNWRIEKSTQVIAHSKSEVFPDKDLFLNHHITSLLKNDFFIPLDPIIRFSSGIDLVLFSTDGYEPWIISLKKDISYVANGNTTLVNEFNQNIDPVELPSNMVPLFFECATIAYSENSLILNNTHKKQIIINSPWRVCDNNGLSFESAHYDDNSRKYISDIVGFRTSKKGDIQHFMSNGCVIEQIRL